MGVLGYKGDGGGELVVLFVDVAVEEWGVQAAVDQVEAQVVDVGQEAQLQNVGWAGLIAKYSDGK